MPTPLMAQYRRIKDVHRDALLFFRLGDFYELFYEDARTASRVLGITLTARNKEGENVPMAGVPHHAAAGYIRKLLAHGFKVAVCDQVQDPRTAKGIVAREVTRVVTPGTAIDEAFLDAAAENLLVAMAPPARAGEPAGLAWADLSTGRFEATDLPLAELAAEAARQRPAELLLPESLRGAPAEAWLADLLALAAGRVTYRPDAAFAQDAGRRRLLEHFGVATLAGFGAEGLRAGLGAAAAVLDYLRQTQKAPLSHIAALAPFSRARYLAIDPGALAGLEILSTQAGRREGSLLSVLDRTRTGMGARLLRRWLLHPLTDRAAIESRLDAVAAFAADHALRRAAAEALGAIPDVERIAARLATRRANPRELVALRRALARLPALRARIAEAPALAAGASALVPPPGAEALLAGLAEDPPFEITEGGIFRDGFAEPLDTLRATLRDGRGWIARFQAEEIRRTGIPSLKVGYNRVFGYYIEVTHAHREKIPADYARRQTLKGAERYVTPALKEQEERVLTAQDRAKAWEHERFLALREELAPFVEPLLAAARALAALDVAAALAAVAAEQGYVRPRIVEEPILAARGLRHPVLAARTEAPFVPNDLDFPDGARLLVITGPNMAGKSTYIRQAGLLVVMAQMGSFVPAEEATVGIADKLFARIGAADDISRNMSTFMVEMSEAARILHTATPRSVVILDEIGRGTSTYDGVSLAWAIAERLAGSVRARSLFATHYHEIAALEESVPLVRNLNVLVREEKGDVVFLHKVAPGATDRSYGIHVARLAGVPVPVLARAKEILADLERRAQGSRPPRAAGDGAPAAAPDLLREILADTDIDRLTPLAALNLLKELKEAAAGSKAATAARSRSRRGAGQAGGPSLF